MKTCISKISKLAQCSPGIVYHYLESKDEVMDTLFMSIFSEMMAYVMDESVLNRPIADRYNGLWLRKYYYHFNDPDKTIFIEQYKNSSYNTEQHEQTTQELMGGLIEIGQDDSEQGLVINLPLDIIYTMTFTVATRQQGGDGAFIASIRQSILGQKVKPDYL